MLILASASPRRRQLLEMLGIKDMIVKPSPTEERVGTDAPEEAVKRISLSKAKYVSKLRKPGDIIVAADTIVCLDGHIMGKPRIKQDAFNMLSDLSGRKHSVYTGLALIGDGGERVLCERTDVYFRELTPEEIWAYIETGEPMDKAGAYGAQGRGSVFIERLEGDFFNVMGLPLCRLWQTFREMNYSPQ